MSGETAETSSTPEGASVDAVDQIADLLTDDTDEEVLEGDSNDEGTLSDESTESEAESDENEEGTDQEQDVDDSWESVLGVEEDKLSFDEDGNLSGINVKVDGESSTIKLNDLITGFQTNKAITQKSQLLSEQRKQFEQARDATVVEYKAKLDNVTALSNYLGKQLTSSYDNIDWDRLRTEDPAEYAAMRQDYAVKAQEIQKIQQAVDQERGTQQQQLTQQMQQATSQRVQVEAERMIANNPTWADEKVFNTEMSGMRDFASNQYGFNDNDFNQVQDARIIELLKDAKAYREGVKVAKQKSKKSVPKFQKSSGRRVRKQSKLDKLTKRARNAQGSSKRAAQTDAIAELIGGI